MAPEISIEITIIRLTFTPGRDGGLLVGAGGAQVEPEPGPVDDERHRRRPTRIGQHGQGPDRPVLGSSKSSQPANVLDSGSGGRTPTLAVLIAVGVERPSRRG